MLRRNGPVVKSVESVLRLEGSLWGERFVEEVGLEPGVKERGSYGWWEWWVDRVRKSGRRMNRKDRDRGGEMRLTERTRKLIPETMSAVSFTRYDAPLVFPRLARRRTNDLVQHSVSSSWQIWRQFVWINAQLVSPINVYRCMRISIDHLHRLSLYDDPISNGVFELPF